MTLAGLLTVLAGDPALARVVEAAGSADLDVAAPGGLRPFAIATLAATGRTVLAVTATERESQDLATALRSLLPPDQVVDYPAWETLPHERLSPRADTVGRRLAVLRRLRHPAAEDPTIGPISVVVAPVRSVLQPQASGLGELIPVALQAGDESDFDGVVRALSAIAYTRVDMVERRGEFAVRGGILDVFPPTEDHPVRVEFWGDTVEEVRFFAVADQRSLEVATYGLWAPPCRELLLTDAVRARARALSDRHPELAEMLDKLAAGVPVEGMEALTPVLVDQLVLLVDELPAGTHVVVCDPERVRTRAIDLVGTSQEFLAASWAAAAGGGKAPVDLGAAAYRSIAEVRGRSIEIGLPWWTVTPFATDAETVAEGGTDVEAAVDDVAVRDSESVTSSGHELESYRGNLKRALDDIRGWLRADWRVVIVTEGHGSAQRFVEVLRGEDIAAHLDETLGAEIDSGVVHVTTGGIDAGFTSGLLRLAVLTEADITGARAANKDLHRMPSKRRGTIDPLTLKAGDVVVHEQHGVGRYVDLVQRTVADATREYLVIEYAPSKRGQPGDRLYVPTDSLDQVTKYVGGEAPSLDKMGGGDWAKRKGRARKAVREIAAELIRLYAARMSAPGYAFTADTPWQRELEDAFAYVETPDQLAAIDEVKTDMQAAHPMDRVICGDVGYGKTEIAVRAAFKAVMDGKQAAVLVPTTLLAQQHFTTFTERFASFPVAVRVLSRFQTDGERREILAGLADGTVDVVIGTHRLLQPETRFHDLGLVVVDEEQRFGVEHKEFLKRLRTSVDVLTMSATPIPRTLEMSITGIREMSVIQTPPEERHPVLTFVGAYDERQISAAIRRELLREGQVFYVHNRVESIDRAASRLRDLVPEARIEVAHGQMHEHQLERVMLGFWEREFDVLVCTTIVENGLDISNANTLVIERGDLLGLSQLHQLRGRVGRGRERAYAYVLYPPEKPLTEEAHDRLATIAQNADLGAGMQVAMKDLEIRGAGNLLGGEQSGHIAAVGFDLYMRLVGEAVSEFKGGHVEETLDVRVELPVDAHLPHDYIPGERLRLDAYRRLASAQTDADVEAMRAELRDRYGELPPEVENLLAVATFRAFARGFGVTEVAAQGKYVRFTPLDLRESQVMRVKRLHPGSIVKPATSIALVTAPVTARIGGQPLRDQPLLDWCREVLQSVVGDLSVAASS
ncbi:MAG TPA: transcription-repair coupling factor [Mycobacteriales bacterium]|jgi:transcription-repair coupling factor (superfamily II helicase)|nr:transcription-repair coupling factor [Mycobacteriales bacterium]